MDIHNTAMGARANNAGGSNMISKVFVRAKFCQANEREWMGLFRKFGVQATELSGFDGRRHAVRTLERPNSLVLEYAALRADK